MPAQSQPTHAAGIVVRPAKQPLFLIVSTRGPPGEWTFPKGHVEPGETAEATALREVREEAGILAEIVAPLGTVSYWKGQEAVTAAYFLMRYRGEAEAREGRNVCWTDVETSLRQLSFDDARVMLRRLSEGDLLSHIG